MIVHSPYRIADILADRPDLADLSIAASVREAVVSAA